MKTEPGSSITFGPTSSVVVVGAHPDDAVRACGGVMLRALAARATVTVLAGTDGAALFGKPGIPDGRKTARVRKAEQVRGLRKLGVKRESVFFLGFPDGGIAKLRHGHRTSRAEPYFCPWLCSNHSEKDSYGPRLPFNGEALLTLLSDVLRAIAPTHVFTHHVRDKHPDHRGVTWFVRKALRDMVDEGHLETAPGVCEYLTYVRGMKWPPPGKRIAPAAARALGFPGRVVEVPLSPAEIERKDAALDCFVPILGADYIAHWRRTNEIYWRRPRDT